MPSLTGPERRWIVGVVWTPDGCGHRERRLGVLRDHSRRSIEFTARGQRAFTPLTRELARRARARAADGFGDLEARQHFAIVLDDQIVAVPYIDFRAAPDGDGSTGALIPDARHRERIAAILTAGRSPPALSRATGPRVTDRHP